MAPFGLTLPTCAVQKVVSYLRYCGRGGRTAAIAVFDPNLPPGAADSLVHGGVASPQRYSIGLSA